MPDPRPAVLLLLLLVLLRHANAVSRRILAEWRSVKAAVATATLEAGADSEVAGVVHPGHTPGRGLLLLEDVSPSRVGSFFPPPWFVTELHA